MKLYMLNNHSSKEERKNSFVYYCEYCDFGTFSKRHFDGHCNTKRHKHVIELLNKNKK